jgi:hypothetical protein
MSAPDDPEDLPAPEGHDGAPADERAPDSNPMRALVRKATALPGEHEPGPADAATDEPPGGPAPDSDRLRELLRRAASVPVPAPKADVLRGVQRRIRARSQGKFYADGWSTREEHPRGTYLVTAAVMLVLLAVVYLALVPGGIGRP